MAKAKKVKKVKPVIETPIDPPVDDIPKEQYHSDMIMLNDIITKYGSTVDLFAEIIGFGTSYIRNISMGLRPINEDLNKALKEYLKHHKR